MEPGTARGHWARPAPAPCHLHPSSVPHHTNSNIHTLPRCLTWPISLEHWHYSPLLCPPPSLSPPQSLFLSFTHTHTLASSSPAHCEDDCLSTDIHDTGRMCWIDCVCIWYLSYYQFDERNLRRANCFVLKCPAHHPDEPQQNEAEMFATHSVSVV